ncbi:Glycogen debranching enzyme-like protein [Rubrobacter xylanophilus DSM 9941]|uniref:Glycogen debranching enzyme-like protein n=1 Tax=Rubrobacter xylanophilus (strain DSM 9941 / JCM 11954 / NBRC 16129 / PRD-1) TaxID=266117 RepID=Q1AZ91_RUBXD|nr:glycogen debranching protein [Rubrobacter xylanophilus]ABG03287.1 Glycogen debranching enzyme-like protein [Rubrobacter xylanophilus DSM 9941]
MAPPLFSRRLAWGFFTALALLLPALPASAQGAPDSPTLSVSERLEERRYVTTGERAYVVGTEDGRFPAMGFHTRGEMGGVWSPPIKLLDGIWFGVDGEWLPPATRFTSGYGYVRMELPGREGLAVTRTDFVPDGLRAALFGLTFSAETEQSLTLKVDAHSELMGAYPWGETTPSQKTYNLEDSVSVEHGRLVFRERGTPPAENALPHDWAAVVGSSLEPSGSDTGEDFRGPQDPPVICPASPEEAPDRCDDTAYGKGKGGQLRYEITVPAGETRTVWFAVAGADFDGEASDGEAPEDAVAAAIEEHEAALADPEALLEEKVSGRLALARYTSLDLPGDRRLERGIEWSKQNLADSVQAAEDLEIRETNAGQSYPAPEGELDRARFLGAGFPDYQWLFATDGEYTAFASVAAGQFEPIKDHLRALRDVSEIDNGGSGKVVHEVVTDGSVYFGSNADPGNTDETAKFPSAVALVWRWTGDDAFRDEMYGFARRNMHYIFRELDEDGDLWPEGLGNVEREGMGEEKLDNAVYTIRGLYDLADMARSRGDEETERWAVKRTRAMERRFERAWWFGREGATQYADSLRNPGNERVFQRHWIGATPMEVELVDRRGETVPGLASREHGLAALRERELACYTDRFGMYHTGTGPTAAGGGNPGASCDEHVSEVPSERSIFTLNTAVMAVGEGNYGRLGEDQQRHYTGANAALQLIPDEQPGAMPEIAPSPDYGRSIDRPLNERAMVLQAWGAYGTLWPIVHQWLGVRPDMGRGELSVVPQVPEGSSPISGENIRLGDGSVAVSAERGRNTYRTTVEPDVALEELVVGHTLPRGAKVRSVRLNGERTRYRVEETNRGLEVLVEAGTEGEQELVVRTR